MDESPFAQDLLPGEKILWTGQPARMLFKMEDVILIPFSLFWLVLAVMWEASVLGMWGPVRRFEFWPLGLSLFGLPLVLAASYFTVGRYWYRAWKRRRIWFALTDRRILILSLVFGRHLQAGFLEDVPHLFKTTGRKGYGSLRFGNPPVRVLFFPVHVLEHQDWEAPTFYDVPQVEKVYALVNQARAELKSEGCGE
jgi:hypothetical protein